MVLTAKQQKDLNAAICRYVRDLAGKSEESGALKEALEGLMKGMEVSSEDLEKSRAGLLERKWTSVVRLQKKLMEAEAKLAQVEVDLKRPAGKPGEAGRVSGMPRGPAKCTLQGHRQRVTAVEFHPVFNLAVSSSEDASIKVWDIESGEFERALKGHTNVVNDVSFSPSGEQLASCSSDMSVKLWNFGDTYQCTKTLMGHDHSVSGVVYLPDGEHVASSSRDATVRRERRSGRVTAFVPSAGMETGRAKLPAATTERSLLAVRMIIACACGIPRLAAVPRKMRIWHVC